MSKQISLITFFLIALIVSTQGQVPDVIPKQFVRTYASTDRMIKGDLNKPKAISLSAIKNSGNFGTDFTTVIPTDRDSIRRYYYSVGIGLFEFFQVGVGYQINSQYSFSVKYANTWLAYGGGFVAVPGNGGGWGIAVNYFKSIGVFNNIRFESIYYTDLPPLYYNDTFNKNHGFYFQINLAQENILKSEKFIELYWYVGVGGNILRRGKSFVFPTIGIGLMKNR